MRLGWLALVAAARVGCTTKSAAPQEPPAVKPPRVHTLSAAQQPPRRLVVMLHGVGDTADGLLPLARALAPVASDADVLVPDGLHGFDGGGIGRQWFSRRGLTDANRPARVEEAGAHLSTWLDGELRARSLDGSRLVVVGFSQGAILAQWLALKRSPAPTVVSLAGRLAVPGDGAAAPGARVLLVHGTDDEVMPVALAQEALAGLRARGAQVELKVLPGLGHGIDARAVAEVRAFLQP